MAKELLRVEHIGMKFNLSKERVNDFREYVIRMLKGKKLEKDEFWALKDINFSIHEGERIGILGLNGAGKSTLLKVVAGVFKAAHQVKIDGKEIELSFKEFELLSYFVENQGIALSREKILNNVWDYDYFGDARTIDTHVKKLRSKLGEKGNYIKTIWGMGYKFEVDEA